jgi:hypothetical protein
MAETTPNPAPWKTWLLKAAIAVGVLVLVLGIPVLVLHSQAEGEWRQLEAAHIAKGAQPRLAIDHPAGSARGKEFCVHAGDGAFE